MHEETIPVDQAISQRARKITTILTAVILLAPNSITIQSSDWFSQIQLGSVLWIMYFGGYSIPWMFLPFMILYSMPMHIPRFVFVYLIYRYYLGRTTKKRALAVGLLSELWWWIPNLPMMIFMMTSPFGYLYLSLPIPISFLLVIIVMLKYPGPDVTTPWKGFKEEPDWWEKPPEKEEKAEEVERKEPPPPPDDEPW